ncbi:MAG: hypothetical protein [Wendovervirus sonii]|uniref:Uncharacterized protein n=1 Tax=phage Lak_Megaphage_Sonny TaxID=3109229 RepID=A0ABZ0Z6M3_9CAUD|nr:MAG: hypothetical protein [phage Lak_Megaphage_Sonny]
MKLHPKVAKFCPGCHGLLQLTNQPVFTAPLIEKPKSDTKTITVIGKPEKRSNSISLF